MTSSELRKITLNFFVTRFDSQLVFHWFYIEFKLTPTNFVEVSKAAAGSSTTTDSTTLCATAEISESTNSRKEVIDDTCELMLHLNIIVFLFIGSN